MALSLSINTILTMLIVGRLLFLRRKMSRAFGPAVSGTYTSVVALLIESASLYTIVALMTVIACGVGSSMQHVLLPMLGQLQVRRSYLLNHHPLSRTHIGHTTSSHHKPSRRRPRFEQGGVHKAENTPVSHADD